MTRELRLVIEPDQRSDLRRAHASRQQLLRARRASASDGAEVSIDGGTPSTVAAVRGNRQTLVVNRSRVYWTNPYRGTVMAVPIDGSAAKELVIDEHNPIDLAVDEASLYWVSGAAAPFLASTA